MRPCPAATGYRFEALECGAGIRQFPEDECGLVGVGLYVKLSHSPAEATVPPHGIGVLALQRVRVEPPAAPPQSRPSSAHSRSRSPGRVRTWRRWRWVRATRSASPGCSPGSASHGPGFRLDSCWACPARCPRWQPTAGRCCPPTTGWPASGVVWTNHADAAGASSVIGSDARPTIHEAAFACVDHPPARDGWPATPGDAPRRPGRRRPRARLRTWSLTRRCARSLNTTMSPGRGPPIDVDVPRRGRGQELHRRIGSGKSAPGARPRSAGQGRRGHRACRSGPPRHARGSARSS